MVFLGSTILVTLLLLGLEWLFGLLDRGRIALVCVVLIWALSDATWSAYMNPGGAVFAFAISFLDSVSPLVLWQWISSGTRKSRQQLRTRPIFSRRPNAAISARRIEEQVPKPPGNDFTRNAPSMGHTVPDRVIVDHITEQTWPRLSDEQMERILDEVKAMQSENILRSLSSPSQSLHPTGHPPINASIRSVTGGLRDVVLIAAGSPASGKTTTLASQSDPAVTIKIEETLDDFQEARALVQQVIDSGRKPVILWIYVDDPGKTVERMFKRAKRIGRTDQLDYMAEAYYKVPQVLEALKNEFSGRLKIHVVDNSGEPGEQKFVADSSRAWSEQEDAIANRAGWAQVEATNRLFWENPQFEVDH
jgi:hypothetical protein